MIEALVVSQVLLWILVLALGVVVLALVRQIGVLNERVAPAGALVVRGGLRVGEAAPALEVEDGSGARRRVGGPDPEGRSTLLFFLSPTCPVCKALLPVLDSIAAAEERWLRVLRVGDGLRSEHEAFVREWKLDPRGYVVSTELALACRVARLPYALLLDEAGVVRAAGLVNTREHLESLFEAKQRGAATLQEYLGDGGGARRVA